MGVVYRAYHSELERTGAVKVMQAITPDPDTVARFRHEAQAIARLRHPNIVDAYDCGEFQGTPYMIVEYIPGGSLAGRMAEGGLDRRTALRYLRGIAAGLDYAHSRGVVHRDVKPANVLLAADDSPVLADFGLAKLMQGSSLKSMTGVTTGTPAYMAPEQVTGSRVGPPADRYSLATIAYEMLTGFIPFEGEALMELLYAQVHRQPPPPSTRDDSLGPQVDDVVMRGLAKDPAARWESATAFVEALAAALGAEPSAGSTMVMAPPVISAVPLAETVVAERVVASQRQSVVTLAYPSPPPRPLEKRRSRKPLLALIGVGIIAALLLTGLAGWTETHRPVTLSLSSNTVTVGDHVAVSADHLPPDQLGRVELWSPQYTFPFRAWQDRQPDVRPGADEDQRRSDEGSRRSERDLLPDLQDSHHGAPGDCIPACLRPRRVRVRVGDGVGVGLEDLGRHQVVERFPPAHHLHLAVSKHQHLRPRHPVVIARHRQAVRAGGAPRDHVSRAKRRHLDVGDEDVRRLAVLAGDRHLAIGGVVRV